MVLHEVDASAVRRLEIFYEELELLNDKVRRLAQKEVPGAAEIYRRNQDALRLCERLRGRWLSHPGGALEETARALRESQDLLDRLAES